MRNLDVTREPDKPRNGDAAHRDGGGVVVLIANAYPPMMFSGATRAFRFAKYLREAGHCVQVIADGEAPEPEPFVARVPAQARSRRGMKALARLADWTQSLLLPYNERLYWVPHAAAKAEEFAATGKVAAVVSTSPPLGSHFAALWIKKRHGVPWIADFRDPLSDNPFHEGAVLGSRRLAHAGERLMERWLFSSADWIIANTDTVLERWRRRYPQWSKKFVVIWNGFDPDESAPPAREQPSRPYRVLAHVGVLYGARHPAILLGSLARLIQHGRLKTGDVHVRLVGAIEQSCILASEPAFSFLKARGCLSYTGASVPRQEALREIYSADYLLLLDLNPHHADLQVPAKLFDYATAGKPILAFTPRHSPVERILGRSGLAHVSIPPDLPEPEVDELVLRFLELPPRSLVPNQWFLDQFDMRRQVRMLADLIQRQAAEG